MRWFRYQPSSPLLELPVLGSAILLAAMLLLSVLWSR